MGGGGDGTYGGLKNCSSTTYIPRIISVSRKYRPALSRLLSLPWSHRTGFGRRKPAGGGPDGVAKRGADVLKAAILVAGIREVWCRSEDVERARMSAVSGFVLAIMADVAVVEKGLVARVSPSRGLSQR